MERDDRMRFTEAEFVSFIAEILGREERVEVMRESNLGSRLRPDLMIRQGRTISIIEVRHVVPQTEVRLDELLAQLVELRTAALREWPGHEVWLVLAIPGVLAPDKTEGLLGQHVQVWDRQVILNRANAVGLGEEAYRYFGYQYEEPRTRTVADELQFRLRHMNCGRPDWVAYQRLCGNIFEYLFSPPLQAPIPESANASRVNRRDIVLPNYALDGFWYFMRAHYKADFVVVDAKNLCGLVGKNHVLQLANYLSGHGTGLFGMIASRRGADAAAIYTYREQWLLHNKMIIILTDDDLLQMVETKKSGDDPGILIRQKIEDFRLGM
ncbi:hypothetical protein [Catelliglobosispora koreensis]|uniref:hypothetical protein n=1 Tax=Catelliglobosispora koreensis TaxID=129052 RepID=UPI00035FD3D8|nr:hypothetical protein [Catelliglobosispora koreensis]